MVSFSFKFKFEIDHTESVV